MSRITRVVPAQGKMTLEIFYAYLAECASVVRGSVKDGEKLTNRLITEALGKPSRVLEFVPIALDTDSYYYIEYFSSKELQGTRVYKSSIHTYYYTNLRECLELVPKSTVEDWLKYIDFSNYCTLKVSIPYFVYGQLSTHTKVTSVSHSMRFTRSGTIEEAEYFIPREIKATGIATNEWDFLVTNLSSKALREYMQMKGVVDAGILNRGADMLMYREATFGAYTNIPTQWEHLVKLRLDKHTQRETREIVASMNRHIGIKLEEEA